jgi:hypothetical protein
MKGVRGRHTDGGVEDGEPLDDGREILPKSVERFGKRRLGFVQLDSSAKGQCEDAQWVSR